MQGFFITFEGMEGSGKTTQIRKLGEYLQSLKFSLVITREPGGTSIGDQIRKILLDPRSKDMAPLTELLLYASARHQHIEEVIRPALREGKIILCDRYADATVAYQGFGRGIDLKLLKKIHTLSTNDLEPDCTVLLDCSVSAGLARAHQREAKVQNLEAQDRFEKEALDFHERVRQGYLTLAKEHPKRIRVIASEQPEDKIHKEVIKVLEPVLGLK